MLDTAISPIVPAFTRRHVFPGVHIYYCGADAETPQYFFSKMTEHADFLFRIMAGCSIQKAVVPDWRGSTKWVATEGQFRALHPSYRQLGTPKCDAVITNLPVISSTADCHTVIVGQYRQEGLRTAVLHCSRDALHPFSRKTLASAEGPPSVIDALREDWFSPSTYAFIACGIGPEHFENRFDHKENGPFYALAVPYFINRYGSDVVQSTPEHGHLDMPLIIRRNLEKRGVPSTNIEWDRVDTFRDKRFSSRRAGETGTNHIVMAAAE